MNYPKSRNLAITVLLAAGLFTPMSRVLAADLQPLPMAAADSAFYLQINIEQMRNGEASAKLYQWLEDEALHDLRKELGNNLIDSLDGISIFGSGSEQNPAIILHGETTQSMREAIVATFFDEQDKVELLSLHGRNYYAFGDIDIKLEGIHINGMDADALFLAFGDNRQTLLTPDQNILDEFLQQGSFMIDAMSPDLIVIQANRALVQGGMNPHHPIFGDNGPWQSSLFRNVEKFGLVIADATDHIAVSLEAHTANAGYAAALSNIAQGILSLKALADPEDEDEDLQWLNKVHISNDDNIARFDISLPVEQLLQIID